MDDELVKKLKDIANEAPNPEMEKFLEMLLAKHRALSDRLDRLEKLFESHIDLGRH